MDVCCRKREARSFSHIHCCSYSPACQVTTPHSQHYLLAPPKPSTPPCSFGNTPILVLLSSNMPPPYPSLHTLSPDLAYHILSHLSPRDLSISACVSRSWRRLALDDHLWRRFIRAPSGLARRHYLRDSAWRSARAEHSVSSTLPAPPAAVQLLPDDSLLVATLSSHQNGHSKLFYAHDVITVWPSKIAKHEPSCVRTRFCQEKNITYIAFGYRQGFVALYTVSPEPGEDDSPRRVLLERTPAAEPISCVDILLHDGTATVISGTLAGSLAISHPSSEERTDTGSRMVLVPLSQYGICSIAVAQGMRAALVGTAGGEVITFDVTSGARLRYYVGPCSCAVTAVEFASSGVVVAGFAHRVPGNGHRSAAVAWDKCAGARLAAFGRGEAVRSSAAVPAAAVGGIRTDGSDGRRVGLLVGDQARVYELGDWRCEIEAEFGDGASAIDMDCGRLGVACGGREGGGVHVLDFEKASLCSPEEVEWFKPRVREWGAHSHSV